MFFLFNIFSIYIIYIMNKQIIRNYIGLCKKYSLSDILLKYNMNSLSEKDLFNDLKMEFGDTMQKDLIDIYIRYNLSVNGGAKFKRKGSKKLKKKRKHSKKKHSKISSTSTESSKKTE